MKPGSPSKTLRYKQSQQLVLPVEQLQPGMYVAKLDRPWEETPFLFQGFLLEDQDDVSQVQAVCDSVTIDIHSSVEVQVTHNRKGGRTTQTTAVRKSRQPVERALPAARNTFDSSSALVRNIFDDVRLGKAVDAPAARDAVSACVDSIIDNPSALTLLTRIREKDAYTAEHSLSVSILSIALGRRLGMSREQLNELGMCAMLHDVGKIMVPTHILNKPDKLSAAEMEVMKSHTTEGRDVLLSNPDVPGSSIDVAHAHHERLDGSGYPRGLKAHQITPFSKLVAITDTFDAMTADRCYQKGRSNMQAFSLLTKGRNTRWDSEMVIQFIETIGIYPPGTVVQLSSGQVAVVLESHPQLKLRPKVLILTEDLQSASGILNLATTKQGPGGHRLYITTVLSPEHSQPILQHLKYQGVLNTLSD